MNGDNSNTKNNSKILLIIRHAKSSWENGILNDFERPLNDRGKRDAPLMALRVKERNVLIDAFVSSPANRAKTTAEFFAAGFNQSQSNIIYISNLYHASSATLYAAAEAFDDNYTTIAIFAHNPGITAFVHLLVPNIELDNMPTCGVFAIKIHADKWADISNAKKEILFFDYPKLA